MLWQRPLSRSPETAKREFKALQLKAQTRRTIAEMFDRLDYKKLGSIYCDEGGDAFWHDRREPCRQLGIKIAEVLRGRLRAGGQSLYVGAGVAEIPVLLMETLELGRTVVPLTLRRDEVRILNEACQDHPFRYKFLDASKAKGAFDHLWAVSVFNDPERFPHLSALSYGRANPVTFRAKKFMRERKTVARLVSGCLQKLTLPGLVTTSVEELPWIVDWCERRRVPYTIEDETCPTALVQDPVCFIRIGS